MKPQNRSSAVMQQRIEANESLDDFPTPPWATRALIEHVLRPAGVYSPSHYVAEPAANRGYMAVTLQEFFSQVLASDVFDYGAGYPTIDYLFPGMLPGAEWTITNPPFLLAEQFLKRSFETPCWQGTSLILRNAFTEGVTRYQQIFSRIPPAIIAPFAERVIMHKGILRNPEKPYWNEQAQRWQRPSTATAYTWFVWLKGWRETYSRTVWIPPCRKALTKSGDYPGDDE